MVLPDDKNIAWTNMIGTGAIAGVMALLANVLYAFNPSATEIVIACEVLCIATLLLIVRFSSGAEQSQLQQFSGRFMKWLAILLGLSLLAQLLYGSTSAGPAISLSSSSLSAPYSGNSPQCLQSVSRGRWIVEPCEQSQSAAKIAFCERNTWVWAETDAHCPIARFSSSRAQSVFKNKRILFIGDSLVRSSYHQLATLLSPTYDANHTMLQRQAEMNFEAPNGAKLSFVWGPFVHNVTSVVKHLERKPDVLIAGAALWDALHVRDLPQYTQGVAELDATLRQSFSGGNDTFTVWMLPTRITDGRLSTDEKRIHMNEQAVQQYRAAAAKLSSAHVVLDTLPASELRESTSSDGVHYADDVYAVISQMITNLYSLQSPKNYAPKPPKPYVPKITGAMSDPVMGAGVLLLVAIMLFCMDSFLGIGYFSMLVFGISFDWDLAYGPLHAKILRGASSPNSHKNASEDGQEENSKLLGDAA